jgi:hypothetical protein
MTMRRLLLLPIIFGILASGSAFADGEIQKRITPADRIKLEKYGETRKAALAAAQAGEPTEVKQLNDLVALPLVAFSDKDLIGNWQCRTMKLDTGLPLIVYGWFKCKVTDDGSGWMLRKTTGSQRTTGRLYDDDARRAIYIGSLSVNDDPVKPYGSGTETDQVGYAFRTGPNGWRIEFPAPYYESKLDILELKR